MFLRGQSHFRKETDSHPGTVINWYKVFEADTIDCHALDAEAITTAKARRVIGWKCNRCGYEYHHPTDRPPRRNCS